MADVVDVGRWHELISFFREFALDHDCELKMQRFPDGKEVARVECWYKPVVKKEVVDGKINA